MSSLASDAAKPRRELPARVQRAIQAQRRRSEILTGWVQAGLIVLLSALFLASPMTAPDEPGMRPVAVVLILYALFTAIRLWLAYADRLSTTSCALSILVDMALLTFTIWSFHIEYGQPAAFYLKAPTFAYFFIFIALRTLSFSPGLVMFAGVTAAAGWIGLLFYALNEPEGTSLITRDYVDYMTAAKILIGGEVDKIISLVLVAILLALAALRSRRLLYEAATDHAATSQLVRYFPGEVADQLVQADELLKPGQGESREAAIMFIDLRGFTRLAARLEPNEVLTLVGRFQSAAVPIITAHSGAIITYLGDGMMVTFGAASSTNTYAADALRCAQALLEDVGDWAGAGQTPAMGIGIEAGPVICGTIGEVGKLEYAVLGDPVNRAAKFQAHTKQAAMSAITSQHCIDLARQQGFNAHAYSVMPGARQVGGIEAPVQLFGLGKPTAN